MVHASGSSELETVTSQWEVALDTAQVAIVDARDELVEGDAARRLSRLEAERLQTARLLELVAADVGVTPAPWLSPVPVYPALLGLRSDTEACLFDLDGVLTDSGLLHAWAWGEVLDDFLLQMSEHDGPQYRAFDRRHDYRAYFEGRTRVEGLRAFLSSRGLGVGHAAALELARRKGAMVANSLHVRGITALPGARRYLEAAGHAGIARGVVSASASTIPMLKLAGLSGLVDGCMDADVVRVMGLRSRPAPDLLLMSCRVLGVRPESAVTFTRSPAGVLAGRAAGLEVVGVATGAAAELLEGFGADRVVPSLLALLDRRIAGSQAA